MKIKNLTIIFIVVLIIVSGSAFWGGMKYQENKTPVRFGSLNQTQNQFRQRAGNNGGRAVNGEVLNIDTNGLTVKLPDGSSKIVLFNGKTTVIQATASATSNIKTGEKIMVFGTDNSDGSVMAVSIQINPTFGRPF